MRTKTSKIAENVGLLYDYAVTRPTGFTYHEINEKLGWSQRYFRDIVRHLRSVFANDSINLVCSPPGDGSAWIYKLVGRYEDARPWATNRIGDLETRLDTIHNVAESLTHSTDGRTVDGKKARYIEQNMRHLIENLALLKTDG